MLKKSSESLCLEEQYAKIMMWLIEQLYQKKRIKQADYLATKLYQEVFEAQSVFRFKEKSHPFRTSTKLIYEEVETHLFRYLFFAKLINNNRLDLAKELISKSQMLEVPNLLIYLGDIMRLSPRYSDEEASYFYAEKLIFVENVIGKNYCLYAYNNYSETASLNISFLNDSFLRRGENGLSLTEALSQLKEKVSKVWREYSHNSSVEELCEELEDVICSEDYFALHRFRMFTNIRGVLVPEDIYTWFECIVVNDLRELEQTDNKELICQLFQIASRKERAYHIRTIIDIVEMEPDIELRIQSLLMLLHWDPEAVVIKRFLWYCKKHPELKEQFILDFTMPLTIEEYWELFSEIEKPRLFQQLDQWILQIFGNELQEKNQNN